MTTDKPPWSELPGEFYGLDVINVLGGGPSVKPWIDRLHELDGPWIGACRAGLLIDAEITIGCDGRFPRQCHEEIKAALGRGRHVIHPVRPHVSVRQLGHVPDGVRLMGWKSQSLVSDQPDRLCGLDSGFACFNAALIYRPKVIRLFGLDYSAPADSERWHGGYPDTTVKSYDRMLWSWAQQYGKHITKIHEFGVDVQLYVGDPQSRVDRIPRYRIEGLFDEGRAKSA